MLEKFGIWLFSQEERQPVSFIAMLAIIILISTVVSLFVLSVSRHMMWM